MWPLFFSILIFLIRINHADDGSLSRGLPHIRTIGENQLYDSSKPDHNFTSRSPPFQSASNILAQNEDEIVDSCPSAVECKKLGGDCINCNFNKSCVYGSEVSVICQPKRGVVCAGERTFQVSMICRYCYQTHKWEHTCRGTPHCRMAGSPRPRYIANCSVHSEVICLGRRRFPKNVLCNWTSGHRWTTALILSITLGGFGADRFYLGHWQEGIGKLFSFGGLGVWTIVDVILIAVGYLKPADGSVFIW